MIPVHCTECGREHTSGAMDDRWYCLIGLVEGLDVVPYDDALAEFCEHFACGDEHAVLMFSRWLATRSLLKPPGHIPLLPGEKIRHLSDIFANAPRANDA